MKFKFNFKKTIKTVSILSAAGALLSGAIYLQNKQLKTHNKNAITAQYEEKAEKFEIKALKMMPNFGFNNLLANWSYLQFLQYFGDGEAREKTGYALSPDYFETVIKHDPRFVRAYFLLSPATSIFAGEPERGVKTISKGLKSITPDMNSESYYLWVYKAIDEMMFLNDIEAAKKSYQTASAWAEKSDHPNAKNSAANTRQTAQFLEDDPDSLVAQIGAWTMVLNSTNDTKTKKKALEKIEELGGKVIISSDGNVKIRVPENENQSPKS